MYLLQPLDPVCDGPSAAQVQDATDRRTALNDAVDRAIAAVWLDTVRPDLDSRGQVIQYDPATGLPITPAPGTPNWAITPPRYQRIVVSDIPICVRSSPPAALHSRQAGLAGFLPFLGRYPRGLSGSVVAGSGKVAMYPDKKLFDLGETAQIVINGPAGWIVRQRNLWQGRSTGETLEGDRAFFAAANQQGQYTIPPDGRFVMDLKFGPREVGEWVFEFEFVQQEAAGTSTDQGRSLHGGLNWIPASQIQGDPISFAVQGQQDIAPRLDYTAYFADKHATEEYYRQYVAMMEHIPESQVKTPNLVRATLITPEMTADVQRQQAIVNEQNTVRMWGGDKEVAKWVAASDFHGTNPHPIGYPAARMAYSRGDRSGLTPAELRYVEVGDVPIKSYFDDEIYPAPLDLLRAATGKTYTSTAGGSSASGSTSTTAASSPAGSTTAAAGNSTAASIQNLLGTIDSYTPAALPPALKQDVAGMPVWALGLIGLGLVIALKK
jgi:hypothetical protein